MPDDPIPALLYRLNRRHHPCHGLLMFKADLGINT